MILTSGPQERERIAEEIKALTKKLKTIMILVFLLLPVLVFYSFKLDLFKTSDFLSKNELISSVALVSSGSGTGSAFVVGKTKLITARHVLQDLEEGDIVQLRFEKAEPTPIDMEATILYKPDDEGKDYAVLQTNKPMNGFEPFILGNSETIQVNKEIRVVGYPRGLFSSAPGEITNDVFSTRDDLMQLYAGAWPGNSGGPVVDKETNEVIGVLIAGYEEEYKGITIAYKITPIYNDEELKKTAGELSE